MNNATTDAVRDALSVLCHHQRWRSGDLDEAAMLDPKLVGQAIDCILLLVPLLLEGKG